MKHLLLSLSLLLAALTASAQRTQRQETYEVNSPSVWAKNTAISYGIKPSVLDGLADLYEKDGLDSLARHKKVEKLIRDFQVVAPKEQKKLDLSPADRQKLGLTDRPDVAEALEFQLYTQGANSPAVYALGDVKIWYGIPKKAFLGIVAVLEAKQAQIEDFEIKLGESVKNYEDLKAELAAYGPTNPAIKKAEQLLDEGKILEVEKLLKTDFFLRQKGLAYEGYVLGKTEELLLKYDSAAYFYLAAVQNDPNNSTYLAAYASNEATRAHYDEAITYYQKALALDTIAFKDQPEKAALLYNNLGIAWNAKGKYDRAIAFFEKALAIDSVVFGNKHPNVATRYCNLGMVWNAKDEYDRAIAFFEKALPIFIQSFGNGHPNVAVQYNNLGSAWEAKGEYDRAIAFYEKALAIESFSFGGQHPSVSCTYNNLGGGWSRKGEYDNAIILYEKALAIDSVVFGNLHPKVAIRYSNLGSAWHDKGNYDRAIAFYEKALAIDSSVLGNKHPKVAVCYSKFGLAWQAKGQYDQAIAFFEKALAIDSSTFGNRHPKTARQYNNLGSAWQDKGKYDRAIVFYEKALAIDSSALGNGHSEVATCYNNLGTIWQEKGKYDRAIDFFEKALAIDSVTFRKPHPDIAKDYNNLGTAWQKKGEYGRAIAFFEEASAIAIESLGKGHPNTKSVAHNLSITAQNRGMQLFQQGQYAAALPYFQKALANAEAAEDWAFSLTCLNNIGGSHKRLGHHADGLKALEKGIARGEALGRDIDEQTKELPAERLQLPAVQAKIAEMKNLSVIRRMRYHALDCLAGLGRKQEAEQRAALLYAEALEAKDERTVEDLKKDGWVK